MINMDKKKEVKYTYVAYMVRMARSCPTREDGCTRDSAGRRIGRNEGNMRTAGLQKKNAMHECSEFLAIMKKLWE
ncbi:predicted protein [Histoplasma mississippiense (nom. inval.)]|uniref:predicted protein n=1 Tax=Ajellomyces capsulatus (strain NAm1 / WU24) TaxID=2059318 RepID=UPI000157C0BE|nr:predicted protein [Histoplasma mississippiense (nom. inval.)]EDN06438.1 predicted protein [Histoplasma mississippiense (nom. inval.)]